MTGAGDRPGGLLAVHAHPDDETLSTGALLATWAASGAPVTVVTCTRGERGEVIPAELAHLAGDRPALAAHREGELSAALAALGVTDHAFLDALRGVDGTPRRTRYVDSGMAWVSPGVAGPVPDAGPNAFSRVPLDEAAGRLAALIRARRPEVVVAYEPGGGYGHPDHVQAHRLTMRAVELAGQAVPVVLWAAVDADQLAAAEARLPDPPPGLRRAEPGRAAPSAAVPAGQVDLRVDGAAVRDKVLAALRAHATQVQGIGVWPSPDAPALGWLALSDGVLRPLLRWEAYRVAAGSATTVRWPGGVAG